MMKSFEIWVAETRSGKRMIAGYKEEDAFETKCFNRTMDLYVKATRANGGKIYRSLVRAYKVEDAIALVKRKAGGEWYKTSGHLFDVVKER